MPSVGSLVDIRQGGRTVPALAHIGKTGYMFILDRVTGKPVFGVEERPVPKGDVPTEWYSPTQPFPVKPAQPMVRVEFNKERDMVRAEDTSPEHVAECQALYDKSGGFYNAGPYTPFKYHDDGTPPKSTITFPGGTGGVNWGGTAADPTTGLVYMNAHDTSLVGWVEKKKPGVTYSFDAGRVRAALRPCERERRWPVLHLQRAAQGRERQGAGAGRARASAHRGRSSSRSTPTPARWRGRARSASPRSCPRPSS